MKGKKSFINSFIRAKIASKKGPKGIFCAKKLPWNGTTGKQQINKRLKCHKFMKVKSLEGVAGIIGSEELEDAHVEGA